METLWLPKRPSAAPGPVPSARSLAAQAAAYRAYAQRKDAGEFGHTPRVQSMRITIEGGVRVYQALAEWARWAAEYRLPGAGPEE
ncbi:hypothetical protein [Streptacidiphilus carbonis]|uniref:hypothetical protein n=1 Tax=Streptacidiphilus carbonis TaxID=105422 RepID=UPI000AFA7A40|nr:hypothetical protein [Streptacidiphilus carbonis]